MRRLSLIAVCLAALTPIPAIPATSAIPLAAAPAADSAGAAAHAGLVAAINRREYRFSFAPASYRPERGDLWQAPNRAQGLRLYVDEHGIEVLDRSDESEPTLLRLATAAWGPASAPATLPAAQLRADGSALEVRRGAVTERLTNGATGVGLEWQLDTRPEGPLVLLLDVGAAMPRPRGGGVELASGGRRLLLQAPTARDANGSAVPVALTVSARGRLRLEIVPGSAPAPIVAKTLLTGTADRTIESDQDSASLGWSVASAGDVNGDGFADIIVGAPYYDDGEIDEGAAFVFFGSPAGITGSSPTDANGTIESTQGSASLGQSVASAGDVNGDGFADIIVGAPSYHNGEAGEGAAFIFLGSAAGITGSSPADADATIESNQAHASLGGSVAAAGDVNGDGFADVIVGARNYDRTLSDEGAAFVFLGSALGITGSSPADAYAGLHSDQASAHLGASVAAAGDVNGDGFGDVIVGAPAYGASQAEGGAAFVFLGSAAGFGGSSPADAAAVIQCDQAGAEVGTSVAAAGDVNGDGFADVVIGAGGYDDVEIDGGAAFIFLGSAAGITGSFTADADSVIQSDQSGAGLGSAVASAGDVNADGYADVIVGAPLFGHGDSDQGPTPYGAAFVFLGSAAGITASSPANASATIGLDQADADLGASVASAGDVNGDGFADVVVGAPYYNQGEADEGLALVILGSTTGIAAELTADADATIEPDQAGARLGASVASAGDVNGDGFSDFIVGAPFYDDGETDEGAAFVFLGSPAGITACATAGAAAAIESNQADAQLGNAVASAGDVNGDGFADIVIGAHRYDDGESNEGAAFVFLGSPDGVTGSSPADAGAVVESDQVDAFLGTSVASAGDVNGDGFTDLIVGAVGYEHGQSDEGAAFIFLGSTAGISGSSPADAHAMIESDQSGAGLGLSVAAAGDVNGDGFADVVVGAPLYDDGEPDEGAVLLVLGSSSGVTGTTPSGAAALLEPNQPHAHLGTSVASAGDVNGDGFTDIIAGAPDFVPGGAALVFLGSGAGLAGSLPTDAHAMIESDQVGSWLGHAVASAGDVNGDGFADVVTGAPGFFDGDAYGGAVFVFLGSAAGITASSTADADTVIESGQGTAGVGTSVASAGDINGDGFADVIVGAPYQASGETDEGAAFLFLGGGAAGRLTLPQQLDPSAATPLQPWALTGSTGELVVGMHATSPRGRERVRLEVEACPTGAELASGPCASALTGWEDSTATADGTVITANLSGLAPDLYRWRARLQYAPFTVDRALAAPPHPEHGLWRRLQGQAFDADVRTPTPADLAVTIDDRLDTALPGAAVTYVVTAGNPGATDVPGATVRTILPSSLVNVSWTCTGIGGGVCGAAGSGAIADTAELPTGAAVTYILSATVALDATGFLASTATVTVPAGFVDTVPADNTATDTDLVNTTLIFEDGFEDGSTDRWLTVSP